MFGIGPMELVVIVVVALLIFGPQKLPEFARTLGKGLAEFRRASNDLRQSLALDELQNDLRKTMNDATRVPPSRPAQAGDTLPPGSGPAASPASPETAQSAQTAGAAGAATAADSKPPTTAGSEPLAADPPWKGHPGELPEGIDHEHREPGAPATSTATSTAAQPAGDSPAAFAATDPRRDGDPELGNVPVTGVDPSDPRRG